MTSCVIFIVDKQNYPGTRSCTKKVSEQPTSKMVTRDVKVDSWYVGHSR